MECGFECEGFGGWLSCGWKLLRSRGKPQAVLHLTSLNPMVAKELGKKLKGLAERRVTTGGWGAHMRLGTQARLLYITKSPQDLYYSPHF